LIKINLGSKENLQHVKINVDLEPIVSHQLIELLKGVQGHFCLDLQRFERHADIVGLSWTH
jgi:hypothetical protein